MERKNAWKTYSEEDISKLNAISAEYVKFLDNGKTERECVAQTVEMAKAKGYRDLNTVIANGEKLNPAHSHLPVAKNGRCGLSTSGTLSVSTV